MSFVYASSSRRYGQSKTRKISLSFPWIMTQLFSMEHSEFLVALERCLTSGLKIYPECFDTKIARILPISRVEDRSSLSTLSPPPIGRENSPIPMHRVATPTAIIMRRIPRENEAFAVSRAAFEQLDFHYFSLADLIPRRASHLVRAIELFISNGRYNRFSISAPANTLRSLLRSVSLRRHVHRV